MVKIGPILIYFVAPKVRPQNFNLFCINYIEARSFN